MTSCACSIITSPILPLSRRRVMHWPQLPADAGSEQLVDFYRRAPQPLHASGRWTGRLPICRPRSASAPNSVERAALLGMLATAQATGDSQLAASTQFGQALLQLPRRQPLAPAGAAAGVGEVLRLARRPAGTRGKRLQRAEQTFAQLSGSRGWAQRGSQWTAMIHRARAEVFLVEGA